MNAAGRTTGGHAAAGVLATITSAATSWHGDPRSGESGICSPWRICLVARIVAHAGSPGTLPRVSRPGRGGR
ncbi:MAG: hypothetical protein EBZ59_07085 [Planctomycetia bacterium]|nr:hypothetical protein [Planctomycetia bacterium]